ncbi:MAG: hypothetical protein ACLFWB_12600 [Armatimonadota bacterium]
MKNNLLILAAGIVFVCLLAGCGPATVQDTYSPDSWQRTIRTPQTSPRVIVDIKPSSNPNTINLRSQGIVEVAVLSMPHFDAHDIIPQSVKLAGASPVDWSYEDVGVSPATSGGETHSPDGTDDLLVRFRASDLQLDEDAQFASLNGVYKPNGYYVSFEAKDAVQIVGSGPRRPR